MASYKKERIFKLMREKQLPCYVINDGKIESDSQLNPKLSTSEAVERLGETLMEMSGNDVSIEIGSDVGNNGKILSRGRICFERVDLSDSPGTSSRSVNAIAGYNDSPMLKTLMEKNLSLEKALIEAEAQKKIDALTLRMEQLEKGDGSPINGLIQGFIDKPDEMINAISSIWQMIQIKSNPGAVKHLAGVSTNVEMCIERIRRVDLNFDENLNKLADLAEQNPNLYFTAIKFLG
jgi:hypothetical protein